MPPAEPAQTAAVHQRLRDALGGVVLGQDRVIDEVLTALLAGGHVLLEGVPGVAKTLLARTLASALGLSYRRIQFTPDLMPADITGTRIFDLDRNAFSLQQGPVFTQVLLADGINRAPPKTQAALLEAMEEGQVTIDGERHPLGPPFFVIATQNPLDHEGTYPLPEAQLDRFLVKAHLGYPAAADELQVYKRFLAGELGQVARAAAIPAVVSAAELADARASLSQVHVEDKVLAWVAQVVSATRTHPELEVGASPRAGMALLGAARAWAALDGRAFVLPDDIKRMAGPVLGHRLLLTADAELDGRDPAGVLDALMASLEVPR